MELLVDTGSHLTILPRSIFDALGADSAPLLTSSRRVRGVGIGGSQDYARVRAAIAFSHANPPLRPFPIWVAVPVQPDHRLGPVLGMDLLADFRLVVAIREGQVELDPLF